MTSISYRNPPNHATTKDLRQMMHSLAANLTTHALNVHQDASILDTALAAKRVDKPNQNAIQSPQLRLLTRHVRDTAHNLAASMDILSEILVSEAGRIPEAFVTTKPTASHHKNPNSYPNSAIAWAKQHNNTIIPIDLAHSMASKPNENRSIQTLRIGITQAVSRSPKFAPIARGFYGLLQATTETSDD